MGRHTPDSNKNIKTTNIGRQDVESFILFVARKYFGKIE